MELNIYDPIDKLHSSAYAWKCRVRLQTLWKAMNKEKTDFWGLNMIFIDDSNSRIHAFASEKFCTEKVTNAREGEIYILENFKVKEYLGDEPHRPVRNKRHIFFTPHTTFEKDKTYGLQIEACAFDLFDFQEIDKLANDNRFLIDVVGKVENLEPLVKSTKNSQEKKRLKFQLSDGSFTVNVTLFDQLGEDTEAEFRKQDTHNLYVILCCGRPGRYDGSPSITNYPATRIHINPDHYSVKDLTARMKDKLQIPVPPIPLDISPAREEVIKTVLTVKDIRNLPPDFTEREVVCNVTVKRIDEKSRWYYSKCGLCELEINREKGVYYCERCPRIVPYPDKRFRFCTFCSDHTGSIAIIFPDCEVTRLTDTTVTDIHSDCIEEKDEENFPAILRMFLKQKYTITLQLKDENLLKGSTVYGAKEIVESQEISDSCDPNKQLMMEIDAESSMKDNQTEDTISQTPQTGNSSTIKTKTRKVLEPVAFDPKESNDKRPLKNIKIEKP